MAAGNLFAIYYKVVIMTFRLGRKEILRIRIEKPRKTKKDQEKKEKSQEKLRKKEENFKKN